MSKLIMLISGISAGLSVVLGAFASHGLKKKISAEMLAAFKTGVDYQFYHSFALALVGLSLIASNIDESTFLTWAFICFVVGIVFFSGSLYLLALTKKKIFGPVTPLGGLFFILGWLFFILHWVN
ncbi:MAG: DUF423 domain-containing protein [Gammaproteobacteria bacterium]|nr:DUF423 domain-containing protein [Gammaproteobacteria bacterium]